MSRRVRIPRFAGVTNAIYGLGVDLKDGAPTVIGAVAFFVAAIARHIWAGLFILLICYFANRIYLEYKKEAIPGFFVRYLYRIGIGSYSKTLGRCKKFFGDSTPVWAGIAAVVKRKAKETKTWNS